jgi:hypothetical protein
MNEKYNSAKEWRQANYRKLKQYRGEWIIYTKDGVIAHHQDYRIMTQQIDLQNLKCSDYITERIYENEFVEFKQVLKNLRVFRPQSVNKRFGEIEFSIAQKIQKLPTTKLEILGESLLDFSQLQDLIDWLGVH